MRLLFLFLCILAFPVFGTTDHWGVSNQVSATATGTSTKVLDTNLYRKYLMIQNLGATSISVKFGSVQSASEGVIIVANGSYEQVIPSTDSVYVKALSSTDAIFILEGQGY